MDFLFAGEDSDVHFMICTGDGDEERKAQIPVGGKKKHLQLWLMGSVNCVVHSVCVRSHLRGDYEMRRVVESEQLEKTNCV